jgi:hypothetical protein
MVFGNTAPKLRSVALSNIVFHIGFPKTATTTLQSVLRKHDGCDYLGKGLREDMQPSLSLDIASAVFFSNTRHFNARRDTLAAQIADRAAATPCLFISDEAFTFAEHMFITTQWHRQSVSDHDVIANRLAQLCPGAQVMMSLRAQPAFLKSMYRQHAKRGSTSEPFQDHIARELDALPHRSMLHVLRYDHTQAAYADRFGTDRVHVSLFEDSTSDFSSYLHEVADISGLDAESLIAQWGGAHENTDRPLKMGKTGKNLQRLLPSRIGNLIPHSIKT